MDSFRVSKGLVGLVLTLMWGAYALSQFPSGMIGIHHGERRVIILALTLMGIGSLVVSVTPSFALFGIATILMGGGTGLYFVVASSWLTKLYTNTGQVLGFHTAGASLAGFAAPVLAVAASSQFGWRGATAIGAGLAGPLIAAFLLLGNPSPGHLDQDDSTSFALEKIITILRRPPVHYAIFLGVVAYFTWQSIASFLPTFLIEHWNLSTTRANLLFSGFFLINAVCTPVVGRLSDRFSRDLTIGAAMAIAASGVAVMLFEPSGPLAYAGIVVLGIGISWPGALQGIVMDKLQQHQRRFGYGLVRSIYMVIGALGSVVTGLVAETAGWVSAYGVVIGLLAVGIVVVGMNHMPRLEL